MEKIKSFTVRGRALWISLAGDGTANYKKDGFEWSVSLALSPKTRGELKRLGFESKIKETKDGSDYYIRARLTSLDSNGVVYPPPKIVDAKDRPWNSKIVIGSGSIIDLQVKVGYPKKEGYQIGFYIEKIRVVELMALDSEEHQQEMAENIGEMPSSVLLASEELIVEKVSETTIQTPLSMVDGKVQKGQRNKLTHPLPKPPPPSGQAPKKSSKTVRNRSGGGRSQLFSGISSEKLAMGQYEGAVAIEPEDDSYPYMPRPSSEWKNFNWW